MRIFNLFGKEAQRNVVEMSTERAFEKVANKSEVTKAIQDYLQLQEEFLRLGGGREYPEDRRRRLELRQHIVAKLAAEGVSLEFVEGKDGSGEIVDTSVEAFVALYQQQEEERLAAEAAPAAAASEDNDAEGKTLQRAA